MRYFKVLNWIPELKPYFHRGNYVFMRVDGSQAYVYDFVEHSASHANKLKVYCAETHLKIYRKDGKIYKNIITDFVEYSEKDYYTEIEKYAIMDELCS